MTRHTIDSAQVRNANASQIVAERASNQRAVQMVQRLLSKISALRNTVRQQQMQHIDVATQLGRQCRESQRRLVALDSTQQIADQEFKRREDDLKRENQTLREQSEGLREQNLQHQEHSAVALENAERGIIQLERRLAEAAASHASEVGSLRQKLHREAARSKDDLANCRSAIKSLEQELLKESEQRLIYATQASRMRGEVENLNRDLAQRDLSLARAKQDEAHQRAALLRLEQELVNRQESMANLQTLVDEQRRTIAEQGAGLIHNDRQLVTARQKLTATRRARTELQSRLKQLQMQLDAALKSDSSRQTLIAQWENRFADLQKRQNENDREICEGRATIVELRQKLAESNDQLDGEQQRNANQARWLLSMKSQLSERLCGLASAQAVQLSQAGEISRLQAKVEVCNQQLIEQQESAAWREAVICILGQKLFERDTLLVRQLELSQDRQARFAHSHMEHKQAMCELRSRCSQLEDSERQCKPELNDCKQELQHVQQSLEQKLVVARRAEQQSISELREARQQYQNTIEGMRQEHFYLESSNRELAVLLSNAQQARRLLVKKIDTTVQQSNAATETLRADMDVALGELAFAKQSLANLEAQSRSLSSKLESLSKLRQRDQTEVAQLSEQLQWVEDRERKLRQDHQRIEHSLRKRERAHEQSRSALDLKIQELGKHRTRQLKVRIERECIVATLSTQLELAITARLCGERQLADQKRNMIRAEVQLESLTQQLQMTAAARRKAESALKNVAIKADERSIVQVTATTLEAERRVERLTKQLEATQNLCQSVRRKSQAQLKQLSSENEVLRAELARASQRAA